MSARIPVAILGATGTVGQKFVRLLADHPWFEIAAVAASDQSAGRRYGDIVRWREPVPLPDRVADMTVRHSRPPLEARVVFSALDAEVALEIEQDFARAGAVVVTNTRCHRMDPDVPLLIPEVNAHHVCLLDFQRRERGWSGAILANPNCSTAALVLALAPLHAAFGLRQLFVATMQAASGAGYPGVPSLDLLGSVIPFIGGEEDKIERETRKIFGAATPTGVTDLDVRIAAHCNRVPVVDGHLEVVSAAFRRKPTPEQAVQVLRDFRGPGLVPTLPSSPTPPIEVEQRPDRPQSRLDVDRGGGMAVTVGRVRPCPLLDLRFALLGHNTVRGAAGAAVQIAELLRAEGRLGG
ncbi:MAG TPA: aspartate-semialdehyde dehydrogenase [Gemmatimonadales bacterium]|nr:aspartate-semialdehyde dehydrogenase [Gemmatimonadales bacterium]